MFSRPQYPRPNYYYPHTPLQHTGQPAGFRMPPTPKPCFNPFVQVPLVPTCAKMSPHIAGMFGPPQLDNRKFVIDDNAPPNNPLSFSTFVPPPANVRPTRAFPHPPQKFNHAQQQNIPGQFPGPASPTSTPLPPSPPSSPVSRKKYGPKHLSFSRFTTNTKRVRNGRHREAAIKALKSKGLMRRNRYEALQEDVRVELATLQDEIEETMEDDDLTDEDRIFMKQFVNLNMDHVYRNDLIEFRELGRRAADGDASRKRAHAKRDRKASRLYKRERAEEEERAENEEREAEERARAQELEAAITRQQAMRLWEREFDRRRRQEQDDRAARERQNREEATRQEQREREQREREERERRIREEAQRQEQARQEAERQAREAEKRAKEAEFRAREAERIAAEAAALAAQRLAKTVAQFDLYDAKWHELRTNKQLPVVFFYELPWPLLDHPVPISPANITYEALQAFIFHPHRPRMEGKSRRDRVKADMLKYHPDKFDSLTLCKVSPPEQSQAAEISGIVARLLTQIMAEEIEREKRN
ncbi:hypothetical protein BJ138DRAFT_1164408 [Hygrophoropsis aurantiaca]|uniref:Uncharacterized protein n=1 Tax=Hygrophoropsis aurantiaca TaxID=72124 RepID=A0ACB7ZX01_9AGAM|nr:hypothetical protein BJ138DRAFT_1164408 [Hygrophoropsis aurantiaca]